MDEDTGAATSLGADIPVGSSVVQGLVSLELPTTTSLIPEGANLYYTNARADARISTWARANNPSGRAPAARVPTITDLDGNLSFSDIDGSVTDAQIPASIARDSELFSVHGTPGDGQVVKWDSGNSRWEAADDAVGMAGSGEANVQVDWNVTDTTSDAFILNKPDDYSWGVQIDTQIVPELNEDAISTPRVSLRDTGTAHHLAFLDWTPANLSRINHLPVGGHIGLRQGVTIRILRVEALWDSTNNRYRVINVNAGILTESSSGTDTELLLTVQAAGATTFAELSGMIALSQIPSTIARDSEIESWALSGNAGTLPVGKFAIGGSSGQVLGRTSTLVVWRDETNADWDATTGSAEIPEQAHDPHHVR